MYKIVNIDTSEIIGYTQIPIYIRVSTAGNFTTTDEENAQGIAYRSTPYNLRGKNGVGVSTTVYLIEVDAGTLVSDLLDISPMIAENNILNNTYFNVGKQTFISTRSIPFGERIIPNVNCKEINLSEALNALNSQEI